MKPAPFHYAIANCLEQALELKARYGEDARFLAGGQSLLPTMNFRLTQPEVLIDINPLSEIAGVKGDLLNGVQIGALTRYRTLERDPIVAKLLPLMKEALPNIAHPQIRNRGTIGGNLAHADPASEMPAVVLTLGGSFNLRSIDGERWIDAADFFVGALTTVIEPDEILVAVRLPGAKAHSGSCFLESSRRRGDFAMIGVACCIRLDETDQCVEARIGLCNAADVPIFATEASESLVGTTIGPTEIMQAVSLVQKAIDPNGSIHASKAFQRHLASVLTSRALATAAERARHDR
jgi:CO/xanthine dehydrogenase FAD-binding subunit